MSDEETIALCSTSPSRLANRRRNWIIRSYCFTYTFVVLLYIFTFGSFNILPSVCTGHYVNFGLMFVIIPYWLGICMLATRIATRRNKDLNCKNVIQLRTHFKAMFTGPSSSGSVDNVPTTSSVEMPITKDKLPCQLAEYRCFQLYSHHRLIVGCVKTNDDYLLVTTEYAGASCADIFKGRCLFNSLKVCWGRLRFKVVSLKQLVNSQRPPFIILAPQNVATNDVQKLLSLEEAEQVLYNKECLAALRKDLNDSKSTDEELRDKLRRDTANILDERLFRLVASRVGPIMKSDPIGWQLLYNNCSHYCNEMMTGKSSCPELETAPLPTLYILYAIGPLIEAVASPRPWLMLLLHIIAFALTMGMVESDFTYEVCILVAVAMEFLPVAYGITKLFNFDGTSRVTVAVIYQMLIKSVTTGFAISLGIMYGHWVTQCLPYVLDEIMLAVSFYAYFQLMGFPFVAVASHVAAYEPGEIGCWNKLFLSLPIALIPFMFIYPVLKLEQYQRGTMTTTPVISNFTTPSSNFTMQ